MLRKLHQLRDDEKGFTLIELLVVILIIGILAAIALPTFLGQQKKGQDASAKSDGRNAVSQVESCYVDEQTYANCLRTSPAMADAKLPTTVTITAQGTTGFTIVAKAGTSTRTFTLVKNPTTGAITRTCNTRGQGSCPSSGTW